MSLFITGENSDFKDYCEKAQHFARSLELEGKDRREAAKKRQARESASKNQSNSTAPPGKPNPGNSGNQPTNGARPAATGAQSSTPTCWGCGKKGHIRRNCLENPSGRLSALAKILKRLIRKTSNSRQSLQPRVAERSNQQQSESVRYRIE